ncbi:MAG: 16S rRNA (cytosine(967)-C(5))-methyltransferase RsmB [Terriglobales bacterium]
MPVSLARAVAFDILKEVEQRQSFAVDLLHGRATDELAPADRALTMQIVMGVLRWQSALDSEIMRASEKKLDLEVRLALRIALFQLRFLDRIPQRAAVNESVELVKRARKRSAAPFVNAVLRKLQTSAGSFQETGDLAQRSAHPPWLVERWTTQYDPARAAVICQFDQQVPETALRLPWELHEEVEGGLLAEGVELAPGNLLANARRVVSGDVTRTAAFREGRVAIQDEGSQLVAALVGKGQHILDCCAAPGGKTSAIAERNPAAHVTAVELHEHRLRLMRKLVRASNVEFVLGDSTILPGTNTFDRILTDVPCSGTGTLARNPEIKWRLTPEDLRDLQARQVAILTSALDRLDKGGRLIYSTCSLEKEENQDVVEGVLAARHPHGLRLISCADELRSLKASGDLVWPQSDSLIEGPYLRTLPGVHPCDGFFAAIIQRA